MWRIFETSSTTADGIGTDTATWYPIRVGKRGELNPVRPG